MTLHTCIPCDKCILYYQTRKVCPVYVGMDLGRGGCLPLFQWGGGGGGGGAGSA